jgi:hypothetical protein
MLLRCLYLPCLAQWQLETRRFGVRSGSPAKRQPESRRLSSYQVPTLDCICLGKPTGSNRRAEPRVSTRSVPFGLARPAEGRNGAKSDRTPVGLEVCQQFCPCNRPHTDDRVGAPWVLQASVLIIFPIRWKSFNLKHRPSTALILWGSHIPVHKHTYGYLPSSALFLTPVITAYF